MPEVATAARRGAERPGQSSLWTIGTVTGLQRSLNLAANCLSSLGSYTGWGTAGAAATSSMLRGAPSYARRAASSRRHQESTSGRRRSSARRSRSVMPPQTPNSTPLSSASARHSVRTGQPMQTALARFCAAPCTNSESGSLCRHAALLAQSTSNAIAGPQVSQVVVRAPHHAMRRGVSLLQTLPSGGEPSLTQPA